MRNRLTLSAFAAILTLSAAALAAAAATAVTVTQKGRAFDMADARLARGQHIQFNNNDQFIHQVYVESAAFTFESEEQEPGTSIDLEFTRPGSFEVRCHIHPKMLLRVDVH